jgi:(p)ppGpp synthase/HD superfamily hydrolase
MREIAITFASYYHKDQSRKYTGEKYIVHPIAVADAIETGLKELGFDPTYIERFTIPAILHDVLEDTTGTYQQITEVFYGDVAEIVLELTDVFTKDRYPCFNRSIRKNLENRRIMNVSFESKIIKFCDIMDNVISITEHDKGFAVNYIAEKEQQINMIKYGTYFNYTQNSEQKMFDYFYDKCKTVLEDCKKML